MDIKIIENRVRMKKLWLFEVKLEEESMEVRCTYTRGTLGVLNEEVVFFGCYVGRNIRYIGHTTTLQRPYFRGFGSYLRPLTPSGPS